MVIECPLERERWNPREGGIATAPQGITPASGRKDHLSLADVDKCLHLKYKCILEPVQSRSMSLNRDLTYNFERAHLLLVKLYLTSLMR